MPSAEPAAAQRFAALAAAFRATPDVHVPGADPRPTGFGCGELVDALVAAGEGTRFDPRQDGRLMQEWVVLASAVEAVWPVSAHDALEFVAAKR